MKGDERKSESGARKAPRPAQGRDGQRGLLWHLFVAFLTFALAAVFLRLGRNAPLLLAARKLPGMTVFGEDMTSHSETSCRNLHASAEVPEVLQPPQRHRLSFCEDAELLEGEGLEGAVLLSCDPNRGNWNTVMGPLRDPNPRGALWLWFSKEDTSGEASKPYPLDLLDYPFDRDFHPLGTAYDSHSRRLYVVNHARARSAIEVFLLEQDELNSGGEASSAKWVARYLRSLEDPLGTHTPNAIAVLPSSDSSKGGEILVSQDHFFARRSPGRRQLQKIYTRILTDANSGGSSFHQWLIWRLGAPLLSRALDVPLLSGLAAQIETLMAIPGGFVVQLAYEYWPAKQGSALDLSPSDGIQTRLVLQGCPFANGLALDAQGKTLALSCTMAPSVRLYEVDLGAGDGGLKDAEGHRTTFTPLTREDSPHLRDARRSRDALLPLHTYTETPLPFLPDNIAFVHSSGPDAAAADRLQVIAAGHPNPLKLIHLAKDPYSVSTEAPHFRKRESPSRVFLLEFERSGASESKASDASSGPAWTLKSQSPLYEARNGPVSVRGRGATAEGEVYERVGVSASAGAAFDPLSGTLVVAGLYGEGVMVCRAGAAGV